MGSSAIACIVRQLATWKPADFLFQSQYRYCRNNFDLCYDFDIYHCVNLLSRYVHSLSHLHSTVFPHEGVRQCGIQQIIIKRLGTGTIDTAQAKLLPTIRMLGKYLGLKGAIRVFRCRPPSDSVVCTVAGSLESASATVQIRKPASREYRSWTTSLPRR